MKTAEDEAVMAEKQEYESLVLQIAPYAARTDHVSIGVVLMRREGEGFAEARFVEDWRSVQCMRPDVDIEALEAMKRELQAVLGEARSRDQVMKILGKSSNGIVISASKGLLSDNVAADLDVLEKQYLRRSRGAGERQAKAGARMKIVRKMREEFERTGVWGYMRHDIAASDYTRPGDTLKVDCGYRPNGVVKMFHAVSLAGVEGAKVLAFSYPQMAEGIRRKEKAEVSLTAIVERVEGNSEREQFAVETLRASEIVVVGEGELAGIAERARVELRV